MTAPPSPAAGATLSRRSALRWAGLAGLAGTAAVGGLGTLTGCTVEPEWTGTLNLLTWDFQPQTIQSLVSQWSAQSTVPVEVNVLPSLGYGAALQTRLRGGDIPHVYYNYSYNSRKFVQEEWAADLAGQPQIDQLLDELYPSARERHVTASGQVLSVPYFSAVHMLMYNAELLRQHGFADPPVGLEQTYRQCKALKSAGQPTPYVSYWVKEYCEEFLIRYLLSEGVVPFNDAGDPVFADDPTSEDVLAWWQSMYREGLTPTSALTDDPAKSAGLMANGEASFFALHHYFLSTVRQLDGPQAQHVQLAMGAVQTLQIGEVLQMGAVSQPPARTDAWALMRYYGWKDAAGKFTVSTQWAKAAGLAAPYRGFFTDPAVQQAYPDYYDLTLLDRTFASGSQVVPARTETWYPGFQAKVGDLVHGLLLGQNSPRQCVADLADAARATRKDGGL
ncbi:ABC transporter substrate-binding protein [Nakamurella aerolata]|uniref:Carbohydrate ABC transporter substrate-binding protein n=1 Tax=Nakamurella aerolata TaxID=1656892 RepID=A0A849A6D0_9ACTN|nr:ABC transporter substrate-binding protein [Nakamurella aerolata]NNG35206.1 carbohydrate ABC transporter substrate-binding protein [Nakamurella aerolata]